MGDGIAVFVVRLEYERAVGVTQITGRRHFCFHRSPRQAHVWAPRSKRCRMFSFPVTIGPPLGRSAASSAKYDMNPSKPFSVVVFWNSASSLSNCAEPSDFAWKRQAIVVMVTRSTHRNVTNPDLMSPSILEVSQFYA